MRNALQELGVEVQFGRAVSDIQTDDHQASVTFSNGKTETYDWVIAADGTASFSPDLTQLPGGAQVQPGERWSFQLWFRDSNPGATSNFSNGVELLFQ